MTRYTVPLSCYTTRYYEKIVYVEANSEQEAIQQAYELQWIGEDTASVDEYVKRSLDIVAVDEDNIGLLHEYTPKGQTS